MREGACIGAATMLQPWTIEVDPQFVCVCVCLLLQYQYLLQSCSRDFVMQKKSQLCFFRSVPRWASTKPSSSKWMTS